MAIRRVKIVIDTESLKSGATTASCIYMLAPSDMNPYNQGQDELGVTVNNGDSVIWSPCGFDPSIPIKLKANANPGVLTTNMEATYNDDGTVTALATKTCNSAIYRFAFVVDDDDYDPYSWDPYITIE
ncbi:MAG: hypothetical protein PVH88_25245 [Ignavibacteria bacterium]|jgi:hypothetical protein